MQNPLVSIKMITYNQEKYIGMAIESVLKQKVDFQYELLIGEDASTDNTKEIVDYYHRKFPDTIKVFHRETRLGIRKNGHDIMQRCRGKYVAVLDGDDYWAYELKLQKQVDYLEKNNEIVGTMHNVYCIDKEGKRLDGRYADFPIKEKHIFYRRNALACEGFGAHTSSYVFRNIKYLLSKEQWKSFIRCKLNLDDKIALTLGMLGKVVYFDDIWSCRRLLFTGEGWVASTYKKNCLYFFAKSYVESERYLKEVFEENVDVSQNILALLKNAKSLALKNPTKENVVVAGNVFVLYIKYLISKLFESK